MTTSNSYVILYKDYADDKSQQFRIELDNYNPSVVHSLVGTFQDCTSFVRYNIPKGHVVTLLDNVTTSKFPFLDRAGRVYDIIGDGAEHVVDLRQYNMNDCVSAFVWRIVDLSQGYVFLFEGADFTGARTTVFPSEWEFNKDHSMVEWYINDRLSAIKWQGLLDTVNMILYEHIGGGVSFQNVGRGQGEVANLKTVSFNDTASSFKFTRVTPVKEVIQDVVIHDVVPHNQTSSTLESKGAVNAKDQPAILNFNYTGSVTESTSVTVTTTHSTGGAIDYSYTWETPSGGRGGTLALALNYNYEASDSNTKSHEETRTVSTNETYTAPAQTRWDYRWIAQTGKVDLQFTTTATRWYTTPFAGTVLDNGYYKRDETVSGRFTGVMFVKTESNFRTEDLDP
ncbi:hypothetical protein [Nannocystis punicea]|uniref:Uncharacterized protein n=1 Tax=Nannocystis punicea TaxID=2995304 RepID=A0ABY7HJL6_9BACT|nr:hypothetical protein [Nannocystis poenicansa]WAS99242.1 hypothetical protein O0S08_24200 [Nannocystis poenicansa]